MLVLTRRTSESIMIGDDVEVMILSVAGDKVRVGIQAPRDIPVFRTEVYLEIQEEGVTGDRGDEPRKGVDVDRALQDLSSS